MDGCNKVTTEQHVALKWQWAYYYDGSMDGWMAVPSMVVVCVRHNETIMAYNSFLLPFGMWPLGFGLNPLSLCLGCMFKKLPLSLVLTLCLHLI
jgi:hypothetical protein